MKKTTKDWIVVYGDRDSIIALKHSNTEPFHSSDRFCTKQYYYIEKTIFPLGPNLPMM